MDVPLFISPLLLNIYAAFHVIVWFFFKKS